MSKTVFREHLGVYEHILTFEEFTRLTDEDVLGPFAGRVELFDGGIYELAPVSAAHGNAATSSFSKLLSWLRLLENGSLTVVADTTLLLSDTNAAQPDLMVVRRREEGYYQASDCEFLIEIRVSMQKHDFERKPLFYAEAGVPEYWAIDVERRLVRMHRRPSLSGYQDVRDVTDEGAVIGPLFAPEARVRLADLL